MASLVVPCPGCPAKLAAPESAVGKQIRCPRCGALATVPALLPAEEVKVVEAKVVGPKAAAPPAPKSDVSVTCCIACNTMIATVGNPVDGIVRCPKCGLPNAARARPADEDDEADRPRKKVRAAAVEDDEDDRPRKKKRPRYADDDDDYAHDRPKRKRPKRKAGGGGALVAGLIVGGLLLVCVGIGVAVALFSGKGSLLAKKSPAPPGWEARSYPQDGFKALLPPGSNHSLHPVEGLGGGRDGRQFGPGGWRWDDTPPVERLAVVNTADWNAPVRIELFVVRYRDRLPSAARDQVLERTGAAGVGDWEVRRVRWLGADAVERVHRAGVMRVVCTGRYIVMAAISGPHGSRARADEEAAFFDNIEVTN